MNTPNFTVTARARLGNDSLLSLFTLTTNKVEEPPATPVHHLHVVDVSGSMMSDLPKLRQDLCSILRSTGEGDRVSIVWFSGRGECGVLFEDEALGNVADYDRMKKAIDRWLRPVGLTGFKEPLSEVTRIAKASTLPCSLIFMSDGCDNQWPRSELTALLKSIAEAKPFQAVAVLEYGYFADRQLLGEIATTLGGVHIFAESYQQYSLELQRLLRNPQASPRVTYKLPVEAAFDYVFAIDEQAKRVLTYEVTNNTVTVPVDFTYFYVLSNAPHMNGQEQADALLIGNQAAAMYAATKIHLLRGDAPVVWELLGKLGDVRFIKRFSTCFGKQAYSDLAADLEMATFSAKERYVNGYDPKATPQKDQITILDFFAALGEGDYIRPNFKYNRIGRKSEPLSFDEQLKEASERYTADPSEENKQALLTLAKRAETQVSFVPDPVDAYAIDGLVMPEGRANLSFRIKRHGKLVLENVPAQYAARLPKEIPTFDYRNYAVIKDGLLNINALDMRLSPEALDKIRLWSAAGRWPENCDRITEDGFVTIDLGLLPMSNLLQAKPVDVKWLFQKEWDLLEAQAALKVYKAQLKEGLQEKTSLAAVYGPELADWLKSIGLTDGGWNPPSQKVEAKDNYRARELYTRIRGYSALPSLNEVKKQREAGKVGKPAALMVPYLETVEGILKDPSMTAEDVRREIQKHVSIWSFAAKQHMAALANAKFSMIVNNTWLSGVRPDETTFQVDVDGTGEQRECIAEQKWVEIPI